jgi:hypothetical protein
MELIQSFLGNFIECEESNDSVIGGIVDLGLAAMTRRKAVSQTYVKVGQGLWCQSWLMGGEES